MKTLLAIRDKAATMPGYKAGQSAADFRKANPEGARQLAEMITRNMPTLVRELSAALSTK